MPTISLMHVFVILVELGLLAFVIWGMCKCFKIIRAQYNN